MRLFGALCVILFAAIFAPFFKAFQQLNLMYATAAYWKSKESVQGGDLGWQKQRAGAPVGTEDFWHAYYASFLALFGQFYIPPYMKSVDLNFFRWGANAEERFCYDLLGYMWVHPGNSGNSYPTIIAGSSEIKGFIDACCEAYQELSAEEQGLLNNFRNAGHIPHDTLVPKYLDELTMRTVRDTSRQQRVESTKTEKMTHEELQNLLLEEMRLNNVEKHAQKLEDATRYWESFDLRKPKKIPSSWSAISKAFRNDEVAIFDARPLFPAGVFNVTMADIATGEGSGADRIPLFNVGKNCISLGQYAAMSSQEPYYTNTKRFPKFFSRFPDVASALGVNDDTLRTQSLLWIGPVQPPLYESAWQPVIHYDEEPNVYVQLTGHQNMVVIPLNFTKPGFGADRHPQLPKLEDLERDNYFKQTQVHLIHLRPGDGLTFPSFAYHSSHPPGSNRISLNFFFIPKWRKMEHTPDNWYSLEAQQSLERLAIRQLWTRSLGHLYDKTGAGVVYMGGKLEYL